MTRTVRIKTPISIALGSAACSTALTTPRCAAVGVPPAGICLKVWRMVCVAEWNVSLKVGTRMVVHS